MFSLVKMPNEVNKNNDSIYKFTHLKLSRLSVRIFNRNKDSSILGDNLSIL